MKKLMIVGFMALLAINANAQFGYGRNGRCGTGQNYPQRGNGNYQNYPNNNYPNSNGNGGYQNYPDENRYGNGHNNQIDYFQREARRRIADGVANGSLNSRESRRLLRNVEQIERKERYYWGDGFLDVRERQDLVNDLAYLDQSIWKERHDFDRQDYNNSERERNQYGDRFGN